MPPAASRRWLLWATISAVILLIAGRYWLGGGRDPVDPDSGGAAEVSAVPVDCPQHEFAIDTAGGVVADIPLAELSDEIPEFHDCQRFIDSSGTGYGPLIAIWAADSLETAFAQAAADSAPAGTLTATRWVPVAMIHNFDSARYAPLGIEHRFNCLYLQRSGSAWNARIVSYGKYAARCKEPRELNDRELAIAPKLSVRVDASVRPPHLPSVARWDRDPRSGHYYIGIRCESEWCEVGESIGIRPSARAAGGAIGAAYLAAFESVADVPVSHAQKMRVIMGKGWYDQQRLAEAGPPLRLGSVTGTIIPHPVIDMIKGTANKFEGRWIPSAYVHVDADYLGKVPFETGGMNKLYLCEDVAGRACPGVTPAMKTAAKCGGSWWGRIDRPRSGTSIGCVSHNSQLNGVIPAGAARWRWMEDDETTWVRCGSACCSNV